MTTIYGKVTISKDKFEKPSYYTGFIEFLDNEMVKIRSDRKETLYFNKTQIIEIIEMEHSDHVYSDF